MKYFVFYRKMSTLGKIIIHSESRVLEPIPLPIFEEKKSVESSSATSVVIDVEIEAIYRDIKKILASGSKHSNDKTFGGKQLVAKAKKLGAVGNLGNKASVIAFINEKYLEHEALKKESSVNYEDNNIGVDGSDEDGSNNNSDSDDYYD